MKGFLMVISGPSGVGKNTVLREILNSPSLPLYPLITYTTRSPRPNEQEGVDYHFVSQQEFERLRDAKYFLEWAKVHGNLYGSPAQECWEHLKKGEIVLAVVDVQGAMSMRRAVPQSVLTFLLPPSLEEWLHRMGDQSLRPEELHLRKKNGAWELEMAVYFDYFVVNREVKQAAQDILHILHAESFRAYRRKELLSKWEGMM